MVMHGLAMNLPWLAFVNVSFAVMILLRHVLLKASDPLYPHIPQLTTLVDASMLGIIILCCVDPDGLAAYCGYQRGALYL
jgi:chromate transport protein ChrA